MTLHMSNGLSEDVFRVLAMMSSQQVSKWINHLVSLFGVLLNLLAKLAVLGPMVGFILLGILATQVMELRREQRAFIRRVGQSPVMSVCQ
ncbi:hypothetical protein [Pseudomonas prosekii]|uniref:hypothetical protein n=1 Tax=Pseudomonas prosekii TaxID=1148509 RepID=UPI00387B7313